MELTSKLFGKTDAGTVTMYTLKNGFGMAVDIINYGGIITSIRVPDKDGEIDDVVLGFDSLEGYLGDHPRFGEIIGRFGNRIGSGRIVLDGQEYQLSQNHDQHTLHGGFRGFGRYLWKAKETHSSNTIGLELNRLSPHLEEGFPGNLNVLVRYELDSDNALTISYEVTTDKPTVINLTNHSYFNLKGSDNGNIYDHELMINSNKITSVDEELIPDGTFTDIEGTPLDFQEPTKIGARIHDDHVLIQLGNGYDHNFVLGLNENPVLAATVYEQETGRFMEVSTNEPGVQLYTSNWMDGSIIGKKGIAYHKHSAFCLETQHYPDSPNHSHFPKTTLLPGEKYASKTVYKFSVLNPK